MTDSFYFKFGLPIHPSVARHFGLQWADAETRYRFHDEGYLTFAEFVQRYVQCRASTVVQEALVAAAQQRPDAGTLLEAALAECLENVRRHSGSPNSQVRLSRDGAGAFLEVEDFGSGLPAEVERNLASGAIDVGVGLTAIRERLAQHLGTLEIYTSPKGTRLRAFVPVRRG